MQDRLGHNRLHALRAEREAGRAALAIEEARLGLAHAAYRRAARDLERTCHVDSPHAPVDRASAAKEMLRSIAIRRAARRLELAECEAELIDYDDLAA